MYKLFPNLASTKPTLKFALTPNCAKPLLCAVFYVYLSFKFTFMSEYLGTFISLFGSISAIIIAFLVLLYDSTKQKLNVSIVNFSNEIKNFTKCSHTAKLGLLEGEDNDYLKAKLLTDYNCGRIDKEKTQTMISILVNAINSADTSEDDKIHLQKYHLYDINYELQVYTDTLDYFTNKFPTYAKISIAIPLLITSLFILIVNFKCLILCKMYETAFNAIIMLIVFTGFYFIYYISIKAVTELNKINL